MNILNVSIKSGIEKGWKVLKIMKLEDWGTAWKINGCLNTFSESIYSVHQEIHKRTK